MTYMQASRSTTRKQASNAGERDETHEQINVRLQVFRWWDLGEEARAEEWNKVEAYPRTNSKASNKLSFNADGEGNVKWWEFAAAPHGAGLDLLELGNAALLVRM
jgi:hypothetical protein